jgi:hypothetical protein
MEAARSSETYEKFIILHGVRNCGLIILERSAVGQYVRYGAGRI